MTNPSPTRHAILSRIRGPRAAAAPELVFEECDAIPRGYLRAGTLDAAHRLDLFQERLEEYDARVHRVAEAALPAVIAACIGERGAKRVAIPAGLPRQWLPATVSFAEADHLANLALDNFDGVLSACAVAIALTGTIVLQTAPGQGPRKLSLVPDYHLCVVFAEQVVETVSEAFDRLAPTATLPTTFVSGPSATADIEMTRIKGVHGPRFLEVILVA
jgi:L-lactate dehydrogenase complex protein LldG